MKFARRQILLAALGLVASSWIVDWLMGGAEPRPAVAKSPEKAESAPAPAAKQPVDVPALIRRLVAAAAESQPHERARNMADPFTPRGAIAELLTPRPTPAAAQAAPSKPAEGVPGAQVLQGVVLGRTRLAVIDGRLCAVGDRFGDYRLVRIERDFVEFSGPDGSIRLGLRPRR